MRLMPPTLLLGSALFGSVAVADQPVWKMDTSLVQESSGLQASRQHPGVFWTHNDSGGSPQLFAITGAGRVLRTVDVKGAAAVDWETLALDDAGNLYIGDIGNNRSTRRDLTIYRVPEPDPAGTEPATVDQVISFRYPDQTNYPDLAKLNFDGEALFWVDGSLYVLSKHRSDQRTTLYRFPTSTSSGPVVPTRISDFDLGGNPQRFGGMATAADVHPSGRYLAVLTYHALFVFPRPATGDDWLSGDPLRIPFDQDHTGQCEAITWDGWSLLMSNEVGELRRVIDPFDLAAGSFPRDR